MNYYHCKKNKEITQWVESHLVLGANWQENADHLCKSQTLFQAENGGFRTKVVLQC